MAHPIPKITYGSDFLPTVISFDYPATEPDGESRVVDRKISTSLSGVNQVQVNNVAAIRTLKFRFISESLKSALETFFETWGAYGKAFRFYEDQNGLTYKSYKIIDADQLDFTYVAPKGAGTFIYETTLSLRRVIDASVPVGYLDMEIANNQASAADVSGLLLDSTSYKTVQVFYEIFRKTNSSERVASGWLKFDYHESTGNWTKLAEQSDSNDNGGDHGVTFTVTNAGQVKYTSDNMSGSGYTSRLLLKNFTILG